MKDYALPKYLIITNEIISLIQTNKLAPGDKIPSENEIIKNYHVSNTTARKVLQEIENGGYVEKIQGRGTFVKDFVIERNASKILSFTRNMVEQGLIPSTRLLETELINKDFPIKVNGNIYLIKKPVFKINRLRLANDIPMMHEIRYISLKICPDVELANLEQSLYNIYRENCNLTISRIEQDLTAIFLDEESKTLLQINNDIPGMLVEGVTFCGKGHLLEGERSVYRADKYKFSVHAEPENTN